MPKTTTAKLKAKLDKLVSEYVRRSNADHKGMVKCFTCGSEVHWKSIHNGHFMSRIHISTRFDYDTTKPSNCNPQCFRCNINLSGQQWTYARKLDLKFGEGTAEEIEKRSKMVVKLSRVDYEEAIANIKEKIKQLTNDC